jgi:endoglycosylceramidase
LRRSWVIALLVVTAMVVTPAASAEPVAPAGGDAAGDTAQNGDSSDTNDAGDGAEGEAEAEQAPRLHQSGRWLVDDDGRVTRLQGLHLVHLDPGACSDDGGALLSEEAVAQLTEHGFNAVRLGILFAGVMPHEGGVDGTYLECVQQTVDLLAQHEVWVLLEFHQHRYGEQFDGHGFPGWATRDDGLADPGPVESASLPTVYTPDAVTRAFDNLWVNREGLWDRYAQAWAAVSETVSDMPYVAGYDLMSEPWPGSMWRACAGEEGCEVFDTQFLQPFWQNTIDAIREVDQERVIWVTGNALHGVGVETHLGRQEPLRGGPIGLSWRTSCSPGAQGEESGEEADAATDEPTDDAGAVGCEERYDRITASANEDADRLDAATLIGTFAATGEASDVAAVIERAEQLLTPWTQGPHRIDDTDEPVFTDEHDGVLDQLVRAYPRATAGAPRALDFDPVSGDLRYRYEPRDADAPTEIVIPQHHYPDGYEVSVSGATVTSEDDAPLITLDNDPEADEVDVRVTAPDRDERIAAHDAAASDGDDDPEADEGADAEPSGTEPRTGDSDEEVAAAPTADHDRPDLPETGGGTLLAVLGVLMLLIASWRPRT